MMDDADEELAVISNRKILMYLMMEMISGVQVAEKVSSVKVCGSEKKVVFFPLYEGNNTIGTKYSKNDIFIKHNAVSRCHCSLYCYKDLVLLIDRRSSNGSFVVRKKSDGLLAGPIGRSAFLADQVHCEDCIPVRVETNESIIVASIPLKLISVEEYSKYQLQKPSNDGVRSSSRAMDTSKLNVSLDDKSGEKDESVLRTPVMLTPVFKASRSAKTEEGTLGKKSHRETLLMITPTQGESVMDDSPAKNVILPGEELKPKHSEGDKDEITGEHTERSQEANEIGGSNEDSSDGSHVSEEKEEESENDHLPPPEKTKQMKEVNMYLTPEDQLSSGVKSLPSPGNDKVDQTSLKMKNQVFGLNVVDSMEVAKKRARLSSDKVNGNEASNENGEESCNNILWNMSKCVDSPQSVEKTRRPQSVVRLTSRNRLTPIKTKNTQEANGSGLSKFILEPSPAAENISDKGEVVDSEFTRETNDKNSSVVEKENDSISQNSVSAAAIEGEGLSSNTEFELKRIVDASQRTLDVAIALTEGLSSDDKEILPESKLHLNKEDINEKVQSSKNLAEKEKMTEDVPDKDGLEYSGDSEKENDCKENTPSCGEQESKYNRKGELKSSLVEDEKSGNARKRKPVSGVQKTGRKKVRKEVKDIAVEVDAERNPEGKCILVFSGFRSTDLAGFKRKFRRNALIEIVEEKCEKAVDARTAKATHLVLPEGVISRSLKLLFFLSLPRPPVLVSSKVIKEYTSGVIPHGVWTLPRDNSYSKTMPDGSKVVFSLVLQNQRREGWEGKVVAVTNGVSTGVKFTKTLLMNLGVSKVIDVKGKIGKNVVILATEKEASRLKKRDNIKGRIYDISFLLHGLVENRFDFDEEAYMY